MRETQTVEFKESVSSTFLKTVSAFANGNGGAIVFGIDDNGDSVGVQNPLQAALDIENKVNDSISPRPLYVIDVDEVSSCITLNVEKGTSKPYFYKSKAYVRRDSSSVEADQLELRRLVMEGSNLSYDEMASSQSSLTFKTLEGKLKDALSISALSGDVLRTLGLVRADGGFTNAGAILADENDAFGIDAARFGSSISQMLDRQRLDGESALAMYDEGVKFFERYYTYEQIESLRRVKVERIPETAFREALANALVHRAWDVQARTRIEAYEDRVEIISPGGLYGDLSEEEYLAGGVSVLRNPLVANVFFRLGLIENFGTGVRRIREVYATSGVRPSFRVGQSSVVVVLPVTDIQFVASGEQQVVLDALSETGRSSSTEIASHVGFGKDKTLRILSDLIDAGEVMKFGAGRAIRYAKANR